MHLSHAFTKLFSHIVFLGNFICKSYDISIQVRCKLIMQHAHSPHSGLADLYTHAVNACYISHVIITRNHTLVHEYTL